jgi:phage-related protein
MQVQVESHVREFILALDLETQAKYKHIRELLEKFGNELRMPYSKKVARGLFELRIRGQQEVRIFYTFYIDSAYLLHGFVKKSQKSPHKEIQVAFARKKLLTGI